MTELAEGVKRIILPEGTIISTGPDFNGMPLARVPQGAVFAHFDKGKREAEDGHGVWFCGIIESPSGLGRSDLGQVWAFLEVKKGKQGGRWRGSNV